MIVAIGIYAFTIQLSHQRSQCSQKSFLTMNLKDKVNKLMVSDNNYVVMGQHFTTQCHTWHSTEGLIIIHKVANYCAVCDAVCDVKSGHTGQSYTLDCQNKHVSAGL